MDLDGQRESENVEDRRGMPGGRTALIGGGLGSVVLAVVYLLLGGDPNALQSGIQSQPSADTSGNPATAASGPEQELRHFASQILAGTEDVWTKEFAARGATYEVPHLVLYSGSTESACGGADSAVGPFYCPSDRKVFLDLSFFNELSRRFGASGEFARAYVIAHEVGHHVQNLMGISGKVRGMQQRLDQHGVNALSVRLELQADCLAGVWANRSQQSFKLNESDIDSALSAASAVGDDRLQKATRGYVTPDSFTHGSSAERTHWFRQGFTSGRLGDCNTFAGQTPDG